MKTIMIAAAVTAAFSVPAVALAGEMAAGAFKNGAGQKVLYASVEDMGGRKIRYCIKQEEVTSCFDWKVKGNWRDGFTFNGQPGKWEFDRSETGFTVLFTTNKGAEFNAVFQAEMTLADF